MNLKILCFNIHKGIGWGSKKFTIHEIQTQIAKLEADIIFLQEVRGSQFKLLTSSFWPHSSYGKNAVYDKDDDHGNVILSKLPIIASDNLDLTVRSYEKRGMLHAKVKFGLEQDLHLLCVHLGLLAKDRRKQLDLILNHIKAHTSKKDLIILSGDFNDWRGYATKPLIKNLGFEEAFLSTKNAYAKTFPAWIPMLKLDRIYYRGFKVEDGARLIKKTWRYLSDHIALTVSLKLK